ncbi:hypothetical protein [Rhizobium leguminosarum]|uniref:hypothetical protein n=1 Tax=Rhizobium leguminosarum TaxID=384 RepID=UPI001C93C918|nr:hypothetical protein [Rhizobium leguminosarum]
MTNAGKLASPLPPTGASDATKCTAISGERHYAVIGEKALLDHTAPNGDLLGKRRADRLDDGAFGLLGRRIGVHDRAAVDNRDHPVHGDACGFGESHCHNRAELQPQPHRSSDVRAVARYLTTARAWTVDDAA